MLLYFHLYHFRLEDVGHIMEQRASKSWLTQGKVEMTRVLNRVRTPQVLPTYPRVVYTRLRQFLYTSESCTHASGTPYIPPNRVRTPQVLPLYLRVVYARIRYSLYISESCTTPYIPPNRVRTPQVLPIYLRVVYARLRYSLYTSESCTHASGTPYIYLRIVYAHTRGFPKIPAL